MINTPPDVLARPEVVRALACGDWSTVLRVVSRETGTSQSVIAIETGVSQPHISRLMSGHVTEPGIRTVRLLCDGLGIPRSLAGLLDRDREPTTDRRQLLEDALAVSGLALAGTTNGLAAVGVADDVQLLTALSAAYRRLEHRMSSRLLVSPVVAHLALLRQLRARAGMPGLGARRLATITSESAGLAAWLYFDLDDRANARHHYRLAVKESLATGHPLLPAYMQASFGQFAVALGDPSQGLRLAADARRSLPRSAPMIARVWLDAIEAVALAEHKDQRALAMLDGAENRLAQSAHDEPAWPWLFRFDVPKLAGYRTIVEARLARWKAAEASFAVAAKRSRSPKQKAVADIEHAQIMAALGDVEYACSIATSAFDAGTLLGSERVVRAVANFRTGLGSRDTRATAELDDRLNNAYKDAP